MLNSKQIAALYLDQGSAEFKKEIKILCDNNFDQVIDLFQIIKSQSKLVRFYSYTRYILTAIFYFAKFNFTAERKIKGLFWNGSLQDFELGLLKVPNFFKKIYYSLRQTIKLSRLIYLYKKSNFNTFIIPDEVYGSALLCFYIFEQNCIILTNFTEFRLSFNILKFENGKKYYWANRWNIHPDPNELKSQQKLGKAYIEEVMNGSVQHRDLKHTYSDRNLFCVGLKNSSSSLNILVALHNVSDAPSAVDMEFDTFEEWYFYLVSQFENTEHTVYVKNHPTAKIKRHRDFILRVRNQLPLNFVMIPDDYRVELSDFDIVCSCDGSILYECAAKKVKALSFAAGYSERLSNVKLHKRNETISASITEVMDQNLDTLSDYEVIFNWHVRMDLNKFGQKNTTRIPPLNELADNSVFRSVYSLGSKSVECKLVTTSQAKLYIYGQDRKDLDNV